MTLQYSPSVVLDFWFDPAVKEKWYFGGENFDAKIADKFGQLLEDAKKGILKEWESRPEGRLALIILLDQFSRNIYRESGKAYEADNKALQLAKTALRNGDDIYFKKTKPEDWQSFIYVVLMHSENLADQQHCVALYQTHGPLHSVPFALEHLDVIARFGRFPNRNKALNRETTVEERQFLDVGGVSWVPSS